MSRRWRAGMCAVLVVAGACTDDSPITAPATEPSSTITTPQTVDTTSPLTQPPSTSDATVADGPSAAPRCASYTASLRGTVPEVLDELSGWALSRQSADVLWGHNDADDGARLYGISAVDGSLVADVTVNGADSNDWEDIATYTDPGGTNWIIISDTGDNAERRDDVQLVLVPEPQLGDTDVTAAGVVTVTWPGGAHDVEALIVDPVTGDAVTIGKRFDGAAEVSIDRIPAASIVAGATVVAQHVGTFAVPTGQEFGPTGASISPDGNTVALLFYNQLTMIWQRTAGSSVADTILRPPTCEVATGSGKLEALAVTPDGTLLVSGEGRPADITAYVP